MFFHEKEEHGKQVILKLSKKHNNRLTPQVIGNYSNESLVLPFNE